MAFEFTANLLLVMRSPCGHSYLALGNAGSLVSKTRYIKSHTSDLKKSSSAWKSVSTFSSYISCI